METEYAVVNKYLMLAERFPRLGYTLKSDSCGFQVLDGPKLIFHSTQIAEIFSFCMGLEHHKAELENRRKK